MTDFSSLFSKVLSPYLMVLAGVVAGRVLNTRKEELAKLLIYILTPIVVFSGTVKVRLEAQYLLLPVLFFCLCSFVCFAALAAARLFFKPPLPNVLAFASGDANSGYFAIPVGMALFGEQALSIIILCSFGFILFENTVGFYVSARGRHTAEESVRKVLRLPAVYAFILGLSANWFGYQLSGSLLELSSNVRGAYSVLGMMMIGLALSDLGPVKFDLPFTAFACISKLLFWPALMAALLLLEKTTIGILGPDVSRVAFFMSSLPLAANTIAIATILETEAERAAVAVLASTVLALGLVPALNAWYNV